MRSEARAHNDDDDIVAIGQERIVNVTNLGAVGRLTLSSSIIFSIKWRSYIQSPRCRKTKQVAVKASKSWRMSRSITFHCWVRWRRNDSDCWPSDDIGNIFRWKIFIWSVYVQDLSFGIKGSGYDSIVSAQRLIRNSWGSMERLSILPNSHNGKQSFSRSVESTFQFFIARLIHGNLKRVEMWETQRMIKHVKTIFRECIRRLSNYVARTCCTFHEWELVGSPTSGNAILIGALSRECAAYAVWVKWQIQFVESQVDEGEVHVNYRDPSLQWQWRSRECK